MQGPDDNDSWSVMMLTMMLIMLMAMMMTMAVFVFATCLRVGNVSSS